MPVRLSPAVTSAMSLSLYIQRIFDDLVQELEANTRARLHSWTGRIWSHASPVRLRARKWRLTCLRSAGIGPSCPEAAAARRL